MIITRLNYNFYTPGSYLVISKQHLVQIRIVEYYVLYDSGKVSLEHLLLSWYPFQT